MSPNESYPQHVVTAVIVAHDGATWLPHVADALLDQTRPVQRVVAVDTGSRDRSGSVLAAKFGQSAVFGMDRSTGYGAAIARALAHRAANVPVPGVPGGPSGERVEWLWLLHDDCEPAPDALEQLLRGAAETPAAAVLGPKLRDWTSREVILEAGVTLDTATRRVTGIEPREVDQGQHDGDRDTLAVSSAGMLVRRDVWEQAGGFDTGMGLFMEDIDFCWRVHAAGYRVRVITDAVAYHVQAATRHRRSVSVGRRARMLDRRNGLLTLLGNLPLRQMLTATAGNIAVSALRITFFLLAKRLTAAMDEAAALIAVLCHPLRMISMRRRRARGRRAAYARVRADLPPGRSARRLAEFAASTLSKSQADTTGSHHASADPTEDDSLLEDNGLARRLLTSPSLLTFVALSAVALVAGRSLIGSGPLSGGSLVPVWGGASDLWRTYIQAFHPSGVGSIAQTPPYLAVIAGLATLLAGKPWLAIDVILIGCVPLAGMSAMLAVRRVTKSALVRVWASASYALLPVAMGVVAAARFGTAVAFILLPLIVAQVGRVFTAGGQQAGRAAWAAGLLVAVGAAFVPLIWLIAFTACGLAAVAFRNTRPGLLRNLAVVMLSAPILLLPWSLTLLSHPASLLLEAGLPQPGAPATGLPARSLMLLSPGGPGLPPYWVAGGLIATAFAALFAGRRRKLITAGWGLALSGFLAAVVVSHLTVQPADGGSVVVWAGLPLAIAGLGLLLAGTAGADALGRMLAGRKVLRAMAGGRGLWAVIVAAVACSAPVLAAVSWLGTGVAGPVRQATGQLVPQLVIVSDGQSRQVRTLVIRSVGGHVSYLLLRGLSPSLADTALTPPPAAQRALGSVVSALIAPDGGMAVSQARLLADLDIGYVLVRSPVDPHLAGVLDNVNGLRLYSTAAGYSLWQLEVPPARLSVLEPDGTVVPVASGQVGALGAKVPVSGGTLLLAEPAGNWSAMVNGHKLTPAASPAGAWAQAFRLPAGGGTLTLGYSGVWHDLALMFELLAFLAVAGLALPGIGGAELAEQQASQARNAERQARGAQDGAAADEDEGVLGVPDLARGLSRSGRARVVAKGKAGRGAAGRGRAGRTAAGRAAAGRAAAGLGKAGLGKAGQGKAGSGKAGGGKAWPGAAGLGAAGLGAAGLGAGGLDAVESGAAAGGAIAGAAAGRAGAGSGQFDRGDAGHNRGRRRPGHSASRSDRAQREQDGRPAAAGRASSPAGRAWPYLDDDTSDTGADADYFEAGQAGRSYQGGERGSGESYRSPAGGRPSAPDSRPPAAGTSPSGRSPSGRSPSGAWPYSDLDAAPGTQGRTPSASDSPYGGSSYGDSPYGGSLYSDGSYSDSAYGGRSHNDSSYSDSAYGDRPYGDSSYSNKPYDGSSQREGAYGDRSYRGGAYGDSPSGGSPYRDDRYGDDPYASPHGDRDAGRDSGARQGRRRWGGPAGGSSDSQRQRSGRGDSARSGRPAGPGGSDRRGRRPAEPAADWPGGEDALEPLPPADGQRRGGRGGWRPDAGSGDEDPGGWQADVDDRDRGRSSSRGWSRPGSGRAGGSSAARHRSDDDRHPDQRWPAAEAEYEGENW